MFFRERTGASHCDPRFHSGGESFLRADWERRRKLAVQSEGRKILWSGERDVWWVTVAADISLTSPQTYLLWRYRVCSVMSKAPDCSCEWARQGSSSHDCFILDMNEPSECTQSANESHAPICQWPLKWGVQNELLLPLLIKTKHSQFCPVFLLSIASIMPCPCHIGGLCLVKIISEQLSCSHYFNILWYLLIPAAGNLIKHIITAYQSPDISDQMAMSSSTQIQYLSVVIYT